MLRICHYFDSVLKKSFSFICFLKYTKGDLRRGHTHENINGWFGYLSKKLKKTKQLHFGRFDKSCHGFTKMTLHFVVDSKWSKF